VGESGEHRGAFGVETVVGDQEGGEVVVGDGLELDHLAAREDGRQDALGGVGDEDEVDLGRRFLEAFEERVGGLDVEALRFDHDPHAMATENGLRARSAMSSAICSMR